MHLKGLVSGKMYRIVKINMPDNARKLGIPNQTYSGGYLMEVGIPVLSNNHTTSRVLETTAE
ncbi:MAG: GH36 C-terminal domain-containing protein [Bacteroidales bacterium]|nr:GH36 C-terminal domain-containing protein [Bacteroidales bacterium]